MFDVFPLFEAALRPVFVNRLSSRTNKRSTYNTGIISNNTSNNTGTSGLSERWRV